jgi:hypothetical protein
LSDVIGKTVGRAAGIVGLGHYVPERVLTNADLEKMVDTSDEWIRSRTGISERRIAADGQMTVDLAEPAARRALEDAGLQPSDVQLIIVATCTPDYFFPLPPHFCRTASSVPAPRSILKRPVPVSFTRSSSRSNLLPAVRQIRCLSWAPM